jgi:rubrerythrin
MSNPQKPSKSPTDLGMNKTGIKMSPREGKELVEGAGAGVTKRSLDVSGLEAVRVSFSREAEPVGTMPPPATLKGAVSAGVEALKGKHPLVFIDLIGDRLAFERTGVRLYEALLAKLEVAQDGEAKPERPTRVQLAAIRDEELAHVGTLVVAMETLGGDPTTLTPSADISATASAGVLKVITDARTTFTQALHATLIAELADNDAWLVLSDLADRLGHEDMAASFRQALADEERHLNLVRAWLTTAIEGQAGLEPSLVPDEAANLPAP